jgi:hypothetical protein
MISVFIVYKVKLVGFKGFKHLLDFASTRKATRKYPPAFALYVVELTNTYEI